MELLHREAGRSGNNDTYASQSDDDDDGDDDDGVFDPVLSDPKNMTNELNYLSLLKRTSLYELSSSSSRSLTKHKTKKHGSSSSGSSFSFDKDVTMDNSSKENKDSIRKESLKESKFEDLDVNDDGDDDDNNYFFHIAFTPVECTIICSTILMGRLFKEPLKLCHKLGFDDVQVLDETFVCLQIDSDGAYDHNYRILQLTKPLSENNISLFFLSSHFGDLVLIPSQLEDKVISILTKNSFEFSDVSGSYIISNSYSPVKTDDNHCSQHLEDRVFQLFKQSNIRPLINHKVSLLLTGSRPSDVEDTLLKTAKIIGSNIIPDYFVITRTSINEVSLILPRSSKTRSILGFHSRHLIGSTQDIINPITIDLTRLPLDSTGIVSGMAGKIINGINSLPALEYPFELNYLSMARSAIIMIPKENILLVTEILNSVDYNALGHQ